MSGIRQLPGLKERELAAFGPCRVCGRPLLGAGAMPLFYCVTIARAGFDVAALQRRVGLQMLCGGNAALAQAMGPDDDMAKIMDGPVTVVVHEECAGNVSHLLALMPEERNQDGPARVDVRPRAPGRSWE